ncbi:MAG: hypothetical protein M0C28_34195 [Candidatus Moduliflexus flocculans]|nr:hypothetical protein [Candidatus Moduliflexus flocculans]
MQPSHRLDQRGRVRIAPKPGGKVLAPLLAGKRPDWKPRSNLPPRWKWRSRPSRRSRPATHPALDPSIKRLYPSSPSLPRPRCANDFGAPSLSERTLQALLFLGIFLLFVAAISFVVWGWKDFSAPVRVAIPFGFTALFFVPGR